MFPKLGLYKMAWKGWHFELGNKLENWTNSFFFATIN
jgi:hypothetical protein